MKRGKIVSVFAAFILVGFAACNGKTTTTSQDARVSTLIRIGHGSVEHPDHPVTIAAKSIEKYVEEHSNGRFNVEVFPGSQIGNTVQLFEMVQMGTVDMTITGIPQMPLFTDALAGMDMPYLFRGDWELMHRALSGAPGREMLANVEADTGVKALGFGFHCWRHFFTNKPILSLADCRGMKLRVMESPVQQDIFKTLGFSPVSINLSDLYQSIQQGTVDGATFDMIGGVTEKYNEIIKYITRSGHISFGNIITMSDKTFSNLSAEDQQMFRDAVAFAEQETYDAVLRLEPIYEQQLKDLGVEIFDIDLEPFYAAVQPMIDRYCAQSPRIQAFVDAVNSMR
jgi:tripartite ATP-independent transporter DctP family solute receptor